MLGEARPGSLGAVDATQGLSGTGRQAPGPRRQSSLGDGNDCFQGRVQGVIWHSRRVRQEDDRELQSHMVVGTGRPSTGN